MFDVCVCAHRVPFLGLRRLLSVIFIQSEPCAAYRLLKEFALIQQWLG